MPGISGFPFPLRTQRDNLLWYEATIPSFSGFLFLLSQTQLRNLKLVCCNARYLGLFISTGSVFGWKDESFKRCNTQFLGLFISTLEIIHREYNVAVRVAMPGISGFSFLRYPLKTIVKSIVSSIIFASNSQNILKSLIFLPVFGFLVFLLT